MRGIILVRSTYTYEGDIIGDEPHGKGRFDYANGDRYIGECKLSKPDGYGVYYYKSGAKYTGFFSDGKIHGIGTFEDSKNVYKGSWRNDRKHGMFWRTQKLRYQTYLQKWKRGKLISFIERQYIRPECLQTTKQNPIKKQKTMQIAYKAREKTCIACCAKPTDAVNTGCGHVAVCYDCLLKCDRCPICRCPIKELIRLYVR
jgi:hypothetical protein